MAQDYREIFFHPLTYIQLALRGIPAIVRHDDTLAMKMYESAITPAFLTFYRKNRKAFEKWRMEDVAKQLPPPMVVAKCLQCRRRRRRIHSKRLLTFNKGVWTQHGSMVERRLRDRSFKERSLYQRLAERLAWRLRRRSDARNNQPKTNYTACLDYFRSVGRAVGLDRGFERGRLVFK